jgi:hypothetical protein
MAPCLTAHNMSWLVTCCSRVPSRNVPSGVSSGRPATTCTNQAREDDTWSKASSPDQAWFILASLCRSFGCPTMSAIARASRGLSWGMHLPSFQNMMSLLCRGMVSWRRPLCRRVGEYLPMRSRKKYVVTTTSPTVQLRGFCKVLYVSAITRTMDKGSACCGLAAGSSDFHLFIMSENWVSRNGCPGVLCLGSPIPLWFKKRATSQSVVLMPAPKGAQPLLSFPCQRDPAKARNSLLHSIWLASPCLCRRQGSWLRDAVYGTQSRQ